MKFNIIPQKFNKKVTIADIKQYLVDEFHNNTEKEKEIVRLKGQLKNALELEIKYNASLVTLDEYKTRLELKEKEITNLENDIKELTRKVKEASNISNNEVIKYKKLESRFDILNNDFKKELKKELEKQQKEFIKNKINEISNLKGHLTKDMVVKVLESKV